MPVSIPVSLLARARCYCRSGEGVVDTARLRALNIETEKDVITAYGWSVLDSGHRFHPTKQGERYTLSEPARRTVLDRLLALNHQRHDEEVKAGLQDKKKPKVQRPKSKAAGALVAQGELIESP